MLDVTSMATFEPVSCVSPPSGFAYTSRLSINSVSCVFNGGVTLSWRALIIRFK